MKKRLILSSLLLIAGLSPQLNAQISHGGSPKSFTSNKSTISLEKVPVKTMQKVDVAALKAEDIHNDKLKDHPWRFGENLYVNLNPENSGVWDKLDDGGRLWRLTVSSEGALTINLTFDKYKLPKGAELYIYNADKSAVLGQFNHKNNKDHGYLATVPIPGSALTIEYYEPADVAFAAEINLWRVTHGYRSATSFTKGLNTSGSCNVNAICSAGDPIRNQIRSVAMLVTGGNGFCTGALINNSANDGTPYFLSANHCYESPNTVVYWFNWQSETCFNPVTSPSYDAMSGASDISRYAESDFWLVELDETPPLEYNVFYAGWDRTQRTNVAEKCWGIHHPDGDIKKISWVNEGVTSSSYLGETGDGTDHWRVGSWSDETTTEGGSSGSPLFDADLQIIGQLHGGYAECGNTDADYYGKLETSWVGGGTSNSRLSDWLDPSNTGVEEMDGYDPNFFHIDGSISDAIITVDTILNDTSQITPSVYICNNGLDPLTNAVVQYQITGKSAVSANWTGNLAKDECELINFPSILLEHNTHNITTTITVAGDENTANNTASTYTLSDSTTVPELLSANVANTRDVALTWTSIGEVIGNDTLFYDGFESGDFSLWESVVTGSGTQGEEGGNPYWYVHNNTSDAFTGSHLAVVNWGYTIDTRIVTETFSIEEGQSLQFFWVSAYSWFVSPNDNGEITVEASTNGGSSWDVIWSCDDIGIWEDYVWYRTRINLDSYAGQDIQLAFRVTGDDNEYVMLDDVLLGTLVDKNVSKNTPVSTTQFNDLNRTKVTTPFIPASNANKKNLIAYAIYRNGTIIGTSSTTSYNDNNVPGGTYNYQVVASYIDPEGYSPASNSIQVMIPPSQLEEVDQPDAGHPLLYPNPSDGTFNLDVNNCYVVRVVNMNGAVLKQQVIESGMNTLNLNHLGSGLYIVHMASEKHTHVLRAIVQ